MKTTAATARFMQEINVSEISKRYGDVVALSRISFALRAREILGIIGPNGSGKTTITERLRAEKYEWGDLRDTPAYTRMHERHQARALSVLSR